MDLKQEFEKETGQGIGYLEGKEEPENNGTYNYAYVEWLEQKLVNLLPLVSCKCTHRASSTDNAKVIIHYCANCR